MPDREATCLCGQLRLEVTGEPFAVSICNCLACKRRTGSAFGMEAGFRTDQVRIEGRYSDYSSTSDEADRKEHIDHFCPDCGSHVFYTEPTEPDFVGVSVGSFADPSFPPPTESGYDSRRHPWIGLPESMRLLAPELWWDHGQPLYEAGKYAEAADKGLELIKARPRPAIPLLQRRVLREPRGTNCRRYRAPSSGDRDVGGLPGDGARRPGLRLDPRPARVPRAVHSQDGRSPVQQATGRRCARVCANVS